MPRKSNQNEEELLLEENVNVEGQDNVDVQVEETNKNNKKLGTNNKENEDETLTEEKEEEKKSFFELGQERYAELSRTPSQVEFGTKQELQKVKMEEIDTSVDETNDSRKTYDLTVGKELYPQYIADNNEIQRDDIMFEELGKNLENTKEINDAYSEEQKQKQDQEKQEQDSEQNN